MQQQGHSELKYIQQFSCVFHIFCFSKLGSYHSFYKSINRWNEAFNKHVEILLTVFRPEVCRMNQSLLNSMLTITCSGKRTGKVAREITYKSYCSTKCVYHYGMKMHLLCFCSFGKLYYAKQLQFTPASVSDTSVYKKAFYELNDWMFFGDKTFSDLNFNAEIMKKHNLEKLTPNKRVKEMSVENRRRIKVPDD